MNRFIIPMAEGKALPIIQTPVPASDEKGTAQHMPPAHLHLHQQQFRGHPHPVYQLRGLCAGRPGHAHTVQEPSSVRLLPSRQTGQSQPLTGIFHTVRKENSPRITSQRPPKGVIPFSTGHQPCVPQYKGGKQADQGRQ